MAGSVRGVEERAWVRDGERRSKRSGEQLPAVQSGKSRENGRGRNLTSTRDSGPVGSSDAGGCSSELRIPSNRCAVVLRRWNVVSEGRNTPAAWNWGASRLHAAVLRGNSGASGGQVEKGWAWGQS